MKMASMKLPKKSEKEMKTEAMPGKADGDRWPYGLQLRFENEQIDKLPYLKTLKVGQKVMVSGSGEVSSLRVSDREGGKEDWSIEIQLHEVGCEGKKKDDSSESMSYDMNMVKAKRRY